MKKKVFKNLNGDFSLPVKIKPKFSVGDKVRISRFKKTFEKGYESNWTEDIFAIDEVLNTSHVTYKSKDMLGEEIKGSFYEQELQKTSQEIFRINKILFKDKTKGRARVNWKGNSNKFNSWIPLEDIE